MDRLPDEVLLQVISFLSFQDTIRLQSVSSRYLTLARDDSIWRLECFTHSRAEALRRRQQLLDAQDSRLAELRNAVTALPGSDLTAWDVSQLRGSPQPRAVSDPEAEARTQQARALANWDPAYLEEKLDYYEEYVHRHAPIKVEWLDLPKAQANADPEELREATGVGVLEDRVSGKSRGLVAPLDDGSICIWDISARSTSQASGRGTLLGQSRPGLLTGRSPSATAESHAIMTETGAVECMSVDSQLRKGYFAVQSLLHEVDLDTLQIMSTKEYPFPITALSETCDTIPMSIGTNWTIHMHDPRDRAFGSSPTSASDSTQLIGGSPYSHATLAQPGPLSILHHSAVGAGDSTSIWVAGRFTSLLNYDRRFFPRLLGTVFSGARVASLASLPFPLIPRSLDLIRDPSVSLHTRMEAQKAPGSTIVAAAEYKGKGSLEFYGLPFADDNKVHYQNRQTASASKLLSAVPHGGRVVFSDGDGNLKWHERDGFSAVRTFNINDTLPKDAEETERQREDAEHYGVWSSTVSEISGQGDIVQKIVPTNPVRASTTGASAANGGEGRSDINQSNLVLWTGDGRLGMLGFGHGSPFGREEEDEEATGELESSAEAVEQKAREDAERQYGRAMRRALERNADEVRFVRGLGMGIARP